MQTRNDHRRDIHSTTMQIRADSANDSERSVECVAATDSPVQVYDWERGAFIDEVLTMAGFQMPANDQLPLLNCHSRWSLDDVFGSARGFRIEGSQLLCRLNFADMSAHQNDPEAKRIERAWTKVKQRHQREVSVGYRVLESVMIPAGQSSVVMGREYKAGQRPLRIATKWTGREVSLTPVAADQNATIRQEENSMNPLLRYLLSIGLRADATMSEAWAHVQNLTDAAQRSEVARIIADNKDLTPPESVRTAIASWTSQTPANPAPGTGIPTTGNPPANQRSETLPGNASPPATAPAGLTPEQQRSIVREEIERERARAAGVSAMFRENNVDNPALMNRAISEGWSTARVAEEILPLVRQRSSAPLNSDAGHIGIHMRQGPTAESLAFAIMLRNGRCPLDYRGFSNEAARGLVHPLLRRDINDPERQRAMDAAHQVNEGIYHWMDVVRMALIVTGQQIPSAQDEMLQRAFSSSAVQDIFTSDINARIVRSYLDAPDSTMGWTRTEERNDFKINEGIMMGKFGALTIHGPGKTADDLDTDTEKYQYRMYRYSGKFCVDEMDIINDRFGALEQSSPEDIGNTAAQIRPNLVYSRLLANATFNGTALFHSSRGNIFSGAGDALSITSVESAEVALSNTRIRNRPLNLPLSWLILPRDLKWKAKQLLQSTERRDNTANLQYGTANTLQGEEINWVADSRIGTGGCVNPETGTAYTGTATNWFAASSPGQNGARTMVVCYRSGTNRAPRIRKFQLTEGKWGIGWDINLDIGCGVEDYRAMQKHAGQ